MARPTTRLEVVADGAKWNVCEIGIGRLSSHPTKDKATAAARAIANIHTPAELVVRNQDGSIETEHSYRAPVK